ncbi:MAG: EamA family transporter [Candidatus Omnitrophota bacterium]|nr:MAG: EamA family transporter [Candidatus Omnitrophota bacterium]
MLSIWLLIFAIFSATIGQIFLKKGMISVGVFSFENVMVLAYFLKAFTNGFVLIGLFFYFFSALIWLIVISRLPLSLAYPCVALGYVLVAILSKYMFNETITFVRWAGIIIICLGVFLISRTA